MKGPWSNLTVFDVYALPWLSDQLRTNPLSLEDQYPAGSISMYSYGYVALDFLDVDQLYIPYAISNIKKLGNKLIAVKRYYFIMGNNKIIKFYKSNLKLLVIMFLKCTSKLGFYFVISVLLSFILALEGKRALENEKWNLRIYDEALWNGYKGIWM